MTHCGSTSEAAARFDNFVVLILYDPYEVPEQPEIILDVVSFIAKENAGLVLGHLLGKGFIRADYWTSSMFLQSASPVRRIRLLHRQSNRVAIVTAPRIGYLLAIRR
jgi:hypothetical protein